MYALKKIFEELVKERFDEITELINEINYNYLIYYFKGNAARKKYNDFNNGIKLFHEVKSGNMNLEEAKNCKMCLN